MKTLQIVLLSVLAACSYGIVHDQITARLCIEYFTVAHPQIFNTTSTTLLALCWGVAATAGIGVALGFILARVSQSGGAPAFPVSRLAESILLLLAVMAASAFTAGLAGYLLSHRGLISIPVDLATVIPDHQDDRFMAVWFAHGASYLVGLAGGAFLCLRIWLARGRPSVISLFPRTRGGCVRAALIAAATAYVIWFRFAAH